MLFNKDFVTNSRVAKDQLSNRDALRTAANINEKRFAPELEAFDIKVNEGIIPQDVYQEFDNQTVERMRSDDGDTFLNDLMGLSKSINIGKLTYTTRMASDAGIVKTSMSGQTGFKMDQVEYSYDGFIVPIHDAGFFRNWRELNAQRSEGFDALIDDQRETVATVRRYLCDTFLDGMTDADGNFLNVDGREWQGIRNDARVASVDLGAGGQNFDYTASGVTGDQIRDAFITTLNTLYITNNVSQDVTVYISREIARNLERKFSTSYAGGNIIDQLNMVQGVASIKVTNKLSGNQLMAFPLDGAVKPLVGMGMSTIALPRPIYNSNYEFVTATALGWYVKNDFSGKTCALYAAG